MNSTSFYIEEPKEIQTDLVPFFSSEHSYIFQELGFPSSPNANSITAFRNQTRVQIKIIRRLILRKGSLHERRIWIIGSVWFDGIPVAIIRNIPLNDNDGSIYPNRFVTNLPQFNLMLKYLFSLIMEEDTGTNNRAVQIALQMYGSGLLKEPSVQQIDSKQNEANISAAIDESYYLATPLEIDI